MADSWLIIYRSYSDAELDDEITWLREESRNIYVQQNLGQKGNQRDLTGIRQRLEKAIRVKMERAGTPLFQDSVADFSQGAGGERSVGTRTGWNI
jgi:ribosomal protein L29